jgi:hypothetical protein
VTKVERRAKHGIVIDSETGEITETNKRKSQRMSTVLNRTATFNKYVKDTQEKKVLDVLSSHSRLVNQDKATKKSKTKSRPPTQDELMRRALDMEEGNMAQHRDYLVIEEEKRRRARVVRPTVEGPLLRWVSKTGEESVLIAADAPPHPSIPTQNTNASYQYYRWDQAPGPSQFTSNPQQPYGLQRPKLPISQPAYANWSGRSVHDDSAPAPAPLHLSSAPVPKEKVEKNYVVIETRQSESAPLPTWKQTMEAMFGDHVKWDEVKVYSGKNRPLCMHSSSSPGSSLTIAVFSAT